LRSAQCEEQYRYKRIARGAHRSKVKLWKKRVIDLIPGGDRS
jgi:hypothetical protein